MILEPNMLTMKPAEYILPLFHENYEFYYGDNDSPFGEMIVTKVGILIVKYCLGKYNPQHLWAPNMKVLWSVDLTAYSQNHHYHDEKFKLTDMELRMYSMHAKNLICEYHNTMGGLLIHGTPE